MWFLPVGSRLIPQGRLPGEAGLVLLGHVGVGLDARPGKGERRAPVRVCSAVTLPSAGVALPRRVLAAVENFRSPLTRGAGPACRNSTCWNSTLPQQRPPLRPGAGVQRIAPSWRVRGEVPDSTRHGSAPWKLAAPDAAKSQPGAAQPGIVEVGRARRGEVPTQRRAALRPWKFAAPGCAKFAPKGRVNRMEGRCVNGDRKCPTCGD